MGASELAEMMIAKAVWTTAIRSREPAFSRLMIEFEDRLVEHI